jgi:alpha-galactosidase
MRCLSILFLVLMSMQSIAQKFDEVAQTPPMGWNSWNTFGASIDEKMVKEIADAIIDLGLKEAGYQYIVLDDGWMDTVRDARGNLQPHPTKFPNGMKAVADYIHSKGLKFGLYSCAGNKTCCGFPASRGHEYQDALKFAEWGVDYLKYDWCNTGKLNAEEAYTTMRDAFYKAGHPVLFSICEWGNSKPWEWAQNIGHCWRTTGDIYNCFNCKFDHGGYYSLGILKILDANDNNILRAASGSGHWNDMDMLEVGNGGLSLHEEQSHFALWALLDSPLMLGNDLRKIDKRTLDILKNNDIIDINQDKLGIQGFKYATQDSIDIWVKPMENNQWAVCFFNRAELTKELIFDWSKQVFEDSIFEYKTTFEKSNIYLIKDLYQHQDIGTTRSVLKQKLEKHQSLVIKLHN